MCCRDICVVIFRVSYCSQYCESQSLCNVKDSRSCAHNFTAFWCADGGMINRNTRQVFCKWCVFTVADIQIVHYGNSIPEFLWSNRLLFCLWYALMQSSWHRLGFKCFNNQLLLRIATNSCMHWLVLVDKRYYVWGMDAANSVFVVAKGRSLGVEVKFNKLWRSRHTILCVCWQLPWCSIIIINVCSHQLLRRPTMTPSQSKHHRSLNLYQYLTIYGNDITYDIII